MGLAVERDYGDVIPAAMSAGAGAAIYSPLAGGALTDDTMSGTVRHPLARPDRAASDKAALTRARVEKLRFLAQATGLSLAQAAVRFILMLEGVTTVLGGFSSTSQIEEIVAATTAAPFEPALMARLAAVWLEG